MGSKKEGNQSKNAIKMASLGSYFSRLSDSMILEIFSFLDEQALCTCSFVSRAFYMFAEEDEQWKTLVIKKHKGDFLFKGTWKRTAILKQNQFKTEPYNQLRFEGIHSEILYRRWYRAHVSLDQWSYLKDQQIDRRSNLSVKEFIEEYDKKNKPVIITDIVSKWPAFKEWTVEKLSKRFKNEKFKTDEVDYFASAKLYMNFNDYMAYARQTCDEDPIYLFDDKIGDREVAKELLNDYEIPKYFKEDYFIHLEEERPPYRWFVIGPSRSGSPFHIDPYRSSAWNAVISGRKRWALYPYEIHPPGVDFEYDDDGNFDSDSPEPMKWFIDTYPNIPQHKKPIEFILEAGELLYVPSGWWHQVLNLTETICVTQNFCNAQNFETICAEIAFDDDDFFDDFKTRISKARPDIRWPTNMPTSGFRK